MKSFCVKNIDKGPSIKDVRSPGGLSNADIFRQGSFFRRGRLHFLVRKTSDFSKFMECPHDQGGEGS